MIGEREYRAFDPRRVLVDGAYLRTLERFPSTAPILCALASRMSYCAVPAWRTQLVRNATLALGTQASTAERRRCAQAMLRATQSAIADVMAASSATPDELCSRVAEFGGTDIYLRARSLRRGVLIAGIHMGAFEPALAVLRRIEPRIHVLFQADPMPRFERARAALRAKLGIIEHRLSEGVGAWSALLDALRADEAFVMHADRTMQGQRGVRMSFLGTSDAELPPGPVRLAAAAGAPIVPTFCVRLPSGLRVWADEVIEMEEARLAAADVADHPAQRRLVASMERAIRAHPEQWMAFMDLRGGDPQ
ncbi:MAG: lysophospholipid acyltransferase family protein [Phycisphaerae bacterium]|nr:lysophospholipid acyltransferase family protein [Phycisphaerae bacterium]